jgi:hypothetical protein
VDDLFLLVVFLTGFLAVLVVAAFIADHMMRHFNLD